MNWRWVKPLESEDLIKEYEKILGIPFLMSTKKL